MWFHQLATSYKHKNVTCFVEETCIEEKNLDAQCDAYLSDALSYTLPSFYEACWWPESKRKWSMTNLVSRKTIFPMQQVTLISLMHQRSHFTFRLRSMPLTAIKSFLQNFVWLDRNNKSFNDWNDKQRLKRKRLSLFANWIK